MAPSTNFLKFKTGFGIADLETSIAEDDPNLPQYYVGRDRYVDRAVDPDDSASVFIGPKGVGKSAILEMVRAHVKTTGNENRLIEIAPDDLAFNALINIKSRTPLLDSPSKSQWLFTSLWDFVLCAEILHRESAGANVLERLLGSVLRDREKKQRDQLVKLTLDDNGKRMSMTDKMLRLVDAIELEGGYDKVTGKAKVSLSDPSEKSEDLKLLQLITSVAKQMPKCLSHEYFVLIDDLDLHWQGTELQNSFLAAMFLSIRKLSRGGAIRFVASLRKSIYREITLEERDKFVPYVCDVNWTQSDIRLMVERRLCFLLNVTERNVWERLFPEGAFEFVWRNTDGMPREVLRLIAICIELAIANSERQVSPSVINDAVVKFSEQRLDELASLNQYKYPNASLVFRQFKGKRKEFDISLIQEVGMKMYDLVDRNNLLKDLDWATGGFEDPVSLSRALLDTGFLKIKAGRSDPARTAEPEEIQLIDSSAWYAVHPMYQSGLGLDGFERFQ
jgi:hypothetical protein